jgi:alcohol dehydrogenase
MLEPLAPFGNHLPIRIRFGDGEISRLPGILAEEGAKSTVVIIDRAVAEHPAIVKALNESPGTITTWI